MDVMWNGDEVVRNGWRRRSSCVGGCDRYALKIMRGTGDMNFGGRKCEEEE